jgi:hypothetical protein
MKSTKYTIDEVRKVFESARYQLLSNEYVNCKTKLQYRCPNNHVKETTFDRFINKQNRCPTCSKSERYTIEYVAKCFSERGYTLLEKEYVNNRQQLNYSCCNGHTTSITFHDLSQGKGCKYCIGRVSYTLQNVIDYFEEHGCKLITTEYINMSQPLDYICSCGEKNKKTFTDFRLGKKSCKKCFADHTRHDMATVKKLFEENGCSLLETQYINNHTDMRYICNCGRESKIAYTNFRRGQRCFECGQRKKEETMLENYGYSYAVQSPIIQDKMKKTGIYWKSYSMPSGKIVKVQGYEGIGIDELLKSGFTEDEIDVHCKTIYREFLYHYNGLYRSYLPDIYIPKTNTIIEIKSDYIYMKERLQNIQKAKCCIALGYEFEFWIYDENKKKKIMKFDSRFNVSWV